jgi:hypothetical protein
MFIDETYLEGLTEKEKNKVREVHDALCAPEDRVWNKICRGLVMKTDQERYPDLIFWFKQDRCYFQYDIETGFLWCEHDLVWEVFEKELNWSYPQIESFIKNKVKEHFQNKDVTPHNLFDDWDNKVEEHFKNKGVTPHLYLELYKSLVKEHFKNKDVTPTASAVPCRYWVKEHFKNKDVTPLCCSSVTSNEVKEHFKNKVLYQR